METKKDKYLPIGSVIQLKGATRYLMIIGYTMIPKQKEYAIYDYCGVLYPEGMISYEHSFLFNHDKIEKIISLGFSNEEADKYRNNIANVLKEIEEDKG